ncbi:MAG TPA: HNH endonuclease signature motif containing protein [Devosiaceae bacterium]|nr:HNH endonuclease signature motif containing protein [Devosiaceae bacterium]
MALDVRDLAVFDRYRNAPGHAFSTGVVTEEDKDAYNRVFSELTTAASSALDSGPLAAFCDTWNARFYRGGGVQGQRPVDLWASIINRPPSFDRFPQIYAIASGAGVEVGFSVSIHEDDYYNASIKARNREIIPAIYRRLPLPSDPMITRLSAELRADGGWRFGLKNRQGPLGTFQTLEELLRFLKTKGSERGGGNIYRIISIQEMGRSFDVERELDRAIARFADLMRSLVPSAAEHAYLDAAGTVREFSEELPEAADDPSARGKRWLLRRVAVRQGQAQFRDRLIEAYGGRCAVTGTGILATLQAAHITPYGGPDTNHVTNGILMRADVHNLFDVGLLQIDPTTMEMVVSPDVQGTGFGRLHRRPLRLPARLKDRPSVAALTTRWNMYLGGLLVASHT